MRRTSGRPKLGQHFLRDVTVCHRIADSLAIEQDDLLVEIGPGRGALTRLLAPLSRSMTAIEVDPELAAFLRDQFQANENVRIIEQNILAADFQALCRERAVKQCYVFGNLPYYITSPILHHLFAAGPSIRRMTMLMQLEVAERVIAKPGRREYGYLSVMAQCSSRPRVLFQVPPGAFSPPPRVDSALVDFEMVRRFPTRDDRWLSGFLHFVQQCFAQKRKSLLNNLSLKYPKARVRQALAGLKLTDLTRAEQMSIEQLAGVYESLNE